MIMTFDGGRHCEDCKHFHCHFNDEPCKSCTAIDSSNWEWESDIDE